MNERIKKLAEQAELNLELQSLKVEKFAELIVRECLDQIQSGLDNTEPESSYNFYRGLETAKDLIEYHFGVEE